VLRTTVALYADRPRAGKDHLARALVGELGFTQLAFADALYEEVSEAYGIPLEILRGDETKDQPLEELAFQRCKDPGFQELLELLGETERLSPRRGVQLWGTEYRRAKDPEYWVDKFARSVGELKGDLLVVTDPRFLNEFKYLETLGCEFWKIIPAGEHSAIDSQGVGHVSNQVGQWWVPDELVLNVFGDDRMVKWAMKQPLRKI
jgi:hypothetical protein